MCPRRSSQSTPPGSLFSAIALVIAESISANLAALNPSWPTSALPAETARSKHTTNPAQRRGCGARSLLGRIIARNMDDSGQRISLNFVGCQLAIEVDNRGDYVIY